MQLPTLNALLNATALFFLLCGRVAIARQQRRLHMCLMLSACFFSTAFLVSYLIYHYSAPQMTSFCGQGWLRIFYYSVLFSHIPLATIVVPAALTALYFAWQQQFTRHRRLVRWLWPIWVYVSLSGVAIYLLLYVFCP